MTGEGKHWGPADPGWVPDPRPVPDALTDTCSRKDYEEPEQRFKGHIHDWATFADLVGHEDVKALARSVL